jgi:hypothetical protein
MVSLTGISVRASALRRDSSLSGVKREAVVPVEQPLPCARGCRGG